MAEKTENFCMEADHYTKCPRFLKDCDAINCEAKYTWQEVEARRGRPIMSLAKKSRGSK
jgi:hypothetical protein